MIKKPKSIEIHCGPGFRVKKTFQRPPLELVQGFKQFDTPDISDLMNRLYSMNSAIRPILKNKHLVGPAFTVKVYPGDNMMVHKSLDLVQPGDVIVVDTGGHRTSAVIGDLVANKAKHLGVAGFIIDGLVRDLPGLLEVGLPIFARGTTPIGPLHRGPGEVNYAISCGGIVVNPGDIITADCNGVVVVHQDFAKEIYNRALVQRKSLEQYILAVKQGKFSNDWVDEILISQNCQFDD